MSEILNMNTIQDYGSFLDLNICNHLIAFIDFRKVKILQHRKKRFGFYGIYLKEKIYGSLTYGRNQYDYQEGTLVFIAPNQVAGIDDGQKTLNPEGFALVFHPDLLQGSFLANQMKNYTFFSYKVNEALHMSERERLTILNSFEAIQEELTHPVDKHSCNIIVSHIGTILNHCMRFYDRQFETRAPINNDVITRFESLMSGYFDSDLPEKNGLPTVAWCADQLHFSANYFGDLIKKETGQSAIDYIHQLVINKVKEQLIGTNKSISEIAYEVGFQYPHNLSRLFKKLDGRTPNEYRLQEKAL